MSAKFDKLANHVTREYEARGVPAERAKLWGEETAAKVARKKGKAPGEGGDGK